MKEIIELSGRWSKKQIYVPKSLRKYLNITVTKVGTRIK